MNRFAFVKLGRTLLLMAAFAVSVSAEEALFHSLSGGGSDLAWLKVEGTGFGQNQNVSGEGTDNDHFRSVGLLLSVKGDVYPGIYYTSTTVKETGMITGFDFIGGGWGGGLIESENNKFPTYYGFCLGLGYILGYDLRLPENFHILIGSSLGFYFEFWNDIIKGWDWSDDGKEWKMMDETGTAFINILSPFIKIQYSSFEIAYRGLVGYYYGSPKLDSVPKEYEKDFSGFDWTRHHLTIGFCFGRNK